MKFNTEIELVNLLKDSLKDLFGNNKIEIFEEVSLGYGIADMVISRLKEPENIGFSDDILNNFDINIYTIISKIGKITLDEIIQITRNPKKKISESIKKLTANKYIQIKECSYSINKEYEFIFSTNIAVEAKLKNWKQALKQAYRYKWFAEYSYVVLDAYYTKRAINNIESFEKYNVGLATITVDGKLIRHFNPKRQKPFDPKMQILFSERIKETYAFER